MIHLGYFMKSQKVVRMNQVNELLDCLVSGDRGNSTLIENFEQLKYSVKTNKLNEITASELKFVLANFLPQTKSMSLV
jgi:hypothetical protein